MGAAQNVAKGHVVSASVTPAPATTSSPITLTVTLTNTAGRELSLWDCNFGRAEFNYSIEIYDDKGGRPPETDYWQAVNDEMIVDPPAGPPKPKLVAVGSCGNTPVKVGGDLVETVDLNKLFDLSLGGRYTIQVQRKDPDSDIPVKSKVVLFAVKTK